MSQPPQDNCLFCQIAQGDNLIWQSEDAAAFKDIHPQAPIHVLVVPKRHITSLAETDQTDQQLLGQLLFAVSEVARQLNLDKDGYRVIINTRDHGGQMVDHLHLHILGGEPIGPLRHQS